MITKAVGRDTVAMLLYTYELCFPGSIGVINELCSNTFYTYDFLSSLEHPPLPIDGSFTGDINKSILINKDFTMNWVFLK